MASSIHPVCGICFHDVVDPQLGPLIEAHWKSKHFFHQHCLFQKIQTDPLNCPVCKQPMDPVMVRFTVAAQAIFDAAHLIPPRHWTAHRWNLMKEYLNSYATRQKMSVETQTDPFITGDWEQLTTNESKSE
jgi:hypothetical protein